MLKFLEKRLWFILDNNNNNNNNKKKKKKKQTTKQVYTDKTSELLKL
jgi:hypothetical protein